MSPSDSGGSSGIWEACQGDRRIEPIQGVLYRLVESQEHIATLSYVDTLEEQAVLEALLDDIKPPWPDDAPRGLHYLLRTPFRYPPLPWGSRFGRRHERGIFYGGLSLAATLAESAYYRFIFYFSMAGPPPADTMESQHSLLQAGYRAERGIRLQKPPFDHHRKALMDPLHYSASQRLGSAMRAADVQAFEYRSARDPAGGDCAGLLTPKAFTRRAPQRLQPWLCQTTAQEISFKAVGARAVHGYDIKNFLVGGVLPWPA